MRFFLTTAMFATLTLMLACGSSGSFGSGSSRAHAQPATQSGSESAENKRAQAPEKEEKADQPQLISGAFLTRCGAADVSDRDVKAGFETIGCAVYERTTQKPYGGATAMESLKIVSKDGHSYVIERGGFRAAPKQSKYRFYSELPRGLMGETAIITGTVIVGQQVNRFAADLEVGSCKGDWETLNEAGSSIGC